MLLFCQGRFCFYLQFLHFSFLVFCYFSTGEFPPNIRTEIFSHAVERFQASSAEMRAMAQDIQRELEITVRKCDVAP